MASSKASKIKKKKNRHIRLRRRSAISVPRHAEFLSLSTNTNTNSYWTQYRVCLCFNHPLYSTTYNIMLKFLYSMESLSCDLHQSVIFTCSLTYWHFQDTFFSILLTWNFPSVVFLHLRSHGLILKSSVADRLSLYASVVPDSCILLFSWRFLPDLNMTRSILLVSSFSI